MATWTVESALNRALSMEKQSYNLYMQAINVASTVEAKTFLKELAEEELKHRAKISDALKNKEKITEIGSNTEKIENLQIIDWLKDTSLSKEVTYQEILIFAGKREQETYEYYVSLSKQIGENEIGQLFSRLAQEELKHKNRIEREYDEYILKEM